MTKSFREICALKCFKIRRPYKYLRQHTLKLKISSRRQHKKIFTFIPEKGMEKSQTHAWRPVTVDTVAQQRADCQVDSGPWGLLANNIFPNLAGSKSCTVHANLHNDGLIIEALRPRCQEGPVPGAQGGLWMTITELTGSPWWAIVADSIWAGGYRL